jgi:hypothetical protein
MRQMDYRDSAGLRGNRMRVGQFLSWLFGAAPAGLAQARLLAGLVPEGLDACSADTLGWAVDRAVRIHQADPATLLRFVFSGLNRRNKAKGAAVAEALIAITPAEKIPALVRAAILARPSWAALVVRTATARVPEQAERIWEAAESVVVGFAFFEPAEALSPGMGFRNPAEPREQSVLS